MEEKKQDRLFWNTGDVMRELQISRPTAYKLMEQSGCILPISRRKRVPVKQFLLYLEREMR